MQKYWRVPSQNSGGSFVNTLSNDDAWTELLTRCASLKWIFIDESEACDNQLLAYCEEKQVACSARHDTFAREDTESQNQKRPWGGTNLLMTGDWWQLTPTGGAALMSYPVKHQGNQIMSSFWYTDNDSFAIQEWKPGVRVMELPKNIRSGHDLLWNDVLEEYRVGRLSEHNFCYLHGFPTTSIWSAPIKFWYECRDQPGSPCTCPTDTANTSQSSQKQVDVCKACLDEKHRRCRWH